MGKRYRWYLVTDTDRVEGTNDDEIAQAACNDEVTLVLDTRESRAIFDGTSDGIVEATREDWLNEDDESEDEGEGEGDE